MNLSPSIFDESAKIFRDVYAPALKDGNEVADFIGMQCGMGVVPPFPLFNLIRQVGIYPEGSTVGIETLNRLGYSAPAIPRLTDLYDIRSTDDAGELMSN